jgi:hypothetical protein
LKPLIPWRLRIAMRASVARRKRAACAAIWPITESAARVPAGWAGWPDGKKFAFVLTHDVEGIEGVEKSRALAEVEMRYGCRSSFNYIPEGTYAVPDELREWLTSHGFEVGVHDLNHDGKLYASERVFRQKAVRINEYLKKWGAVGFRAGFMFHNLEWLHDVHGEYDASTFDVDPFEPQPDGVGTIFPFHVPPPTPGKRDGYIELPYTLPQDSTLFLLFRETTSKTWTDKADWVAQHGGMVLVNVHPDYIQFPGEAPKSSTFPVARYEELLAHIQTRYGNSVWHALPRDVARHVRRSVTAPAGANTASST